MTDAEFNRQNRQLEIMLKNNAEKAEEERKMQAFLQNNVDKDDEGMEYAPQEETLSEKILFYLKAGIVTVLVTGFAFLSYVGVNFLVEKQHERQVMDVARDVAPYFLRDVEIGLDRNNPDLYYYRNDVAAEQILAYDGAADIHSTLYSYYVQYNYHPATQLDEVIEEISERVRQNPEGYSEELRTLATCGDLKGYLAARGITDYVTYENMMNQVMMQYVDNQDLTPSSAEGGRK